VTLLFVSSLCSFINQRTVLREIPISIFVDYTVFVIMFVGSCRIAIVDFSNSSLPGIQMLQHFS
jgi:hypothetical protein